MFLSNALYLRTWLIAPHYSMLALAYLAPRRYSALYNIYIIILLALLTSRHQAAARIGFNVRFIY